MIDKENGGVFSIIVSGLFALIAGSYGYTYKTTLATAKKDEVKDLKDSMAHITERIDKIYEVLIVEKKE